MDAPTIILAVIGIAVAAGAVAAFFSRSQGTNTIKLLQINIQSFKDAEKLKDERIKYLEGQVYSKDQTIKRLSEKS